MKRAALLVPLLVAAFTATAANAATADTSPATAGQYVIVLKSTSDPSSIAARYARDHGAQPGFTYHHALKGFSAYLPAGAVRALRKDPAVAYVEPDAVAHITAQETANGVKRIFAPDNASLKVGDGVDERVDADVAVLDTGIDHNHADLNVVRRVSCVNTSTCTDNAGVDDNGHGSNVAGIVGEIDNTIGFVGVAPGVRLWAIKVLNSSGSGNASGIVAGLDWVTARKADIEVVNMSLGFNGTVQSVNDAVNRAIAAGVVVVVSAGNNNSNVSGQSPANVADAITVSSLSDSDGRPGGTGGGFGWCNSSNTNVDDTKSNFSNWGAGVDIAAPGDCIRSAYRDGGYSNYSGTSQAAPHVAGAAAWLASGSNKPADRAGVLAIRNKIVSAGNLNWTDNSGDGVKEPLLDVHDPAVFPPGSGGGGDPVASFTSSCNNSTKACSFDGSASSDPDGTIASYAWEFGDNTTGTGVNPSHTYASYGTYTVKLTVTDNSGKTGATTRSVTLTDPSANLPPTASFTKFCVIGTCQFDGSASSDPDGSITSHAWNFGDGTSGSGVRVRKSYPNQTRTYTVRLTVTDNKGATGSATATVTCTSGPYYANCTAS